MFCPQCQSEYRAGITDCAQCKVPLVEELKDGGISDADSQAYFEGKPVELVTRGHIGMVKEVQTLLEGNGVPTRIRSDELEDVANMHAIFRLEIATADVERARQVVGNRWKELVAAEGVEAGETKEAVLAEGAETECPACGTRFTPQSAETAECPDCGLFLGVPG